MINFLLGQQSGFTKYPCFLCMWDSRDTAQHYTKKDWPVPEELVPCRARNIINNPLVDEILFLPLHIKLGLIKQFTKALDKDWWLHLLVPCFSRINHRKSWHLWWSSNLSAHPEILSLKTQWTKWNWKHGRLLFWSWTTFLATTRPGTMQNLSPICWLLSETLDATWASKCIFSHMDQFPENLGSISDEKLKFVTFN